VPPRAEQAVDVPVYGVITRFGLSSPRHLLPTVREYRRLQREVADQPPSGLLRSAMLIEDPSTCYSMSFWSGTPLMSGAVPNHVHAARRVFGRLAFDHDRGPELWSTQWRLVSVSNNLNWDGFDLRDLVGLEAA
jgi:hypothetical protein